jgi:hypothetical protein
MTGGVLGVIIPAKCRAPPLAAVRPLPLVDYASLRNSTLRQARLRMSGEI